VFYATFLVRAHCLSFFDSSSSAYVATKKPECGAVGQPNGLIQERVTFRHLRTFFDFFHTGQHPEGRRAQKIDRDDFRSKSGGLHIEHTGETSYRAYHRKMQGKH
jgi:hypothetical protein